MSWNHFSLCQNYIFFSIKTVISPNLPKRISVHLGFLTNAHRGAMRSKPWWVFYRDLDWWSGPQKVQFGENTGYLEVVGLILALLKGIFRLFQSTLLNYATLDNWFVLLVDPILITAVTTEERKKKKIKTELRNSKNISNCVDFSENLNFMNNVKLLVLLCVALRWAMSITDIIVNVTELYDRHNNYTGQCFVLVGIVFCCYNCLDLPWKKFFQVWVTFFPSSWEQECCVEKRLCKFKAFRLRICNLFETLFLLERTGKTSNEKKLSV